MAHGPHDGDDGSDDGLAEPKPEQLRKDVAALLVEVYRVAPAWLAADYLINVAHVMPQHEQDPRKPPKGPPRRPLDAANRSGDTPSPTRKDEPCPPEPNETTAAPEDPGTKDAAAAEGLDEFEQRGLERARKRVALRAGMHS